MIEPWARGKASAGACLVGACALALPGCDTDGGTGGCDPETPNTICTIAGTGTQGGDLVREGPADEIELAFPMDAAVSPDGELWILDFNHFVVRALDAQGRLRTVVGTGHIGDSPEQTERVPAREASFSHIADLAFRDDHLYLAAWRSGRIQRVRLSDMTVERFAGRGARLVYDGDGGPARDAALDLPSGLAFAPDGSLALMDQANQVIRRIAHGQTGAIQTIAGRCVLDLFEACAPGQEPVACAGSQKLTCGDPAQCDSLCAPGFSGDGGPALQARLGQPLGADAEGSGHLAYDPAGNLYFADTDNHRIRKIDTAGVITTIAGTGEPGYGGDGGPAIAAQLNSPVDLALGADGALYLADTLNSCIRRIDPAGTIHGVAGRCSASPADRGFSGDGGPPLDAQLNRPAGLHLAEGKLYIADTRNHRVRVVNLPR